MARFANSMYGARLFFRRKSGYALAPVLVLGQIKSKLKKSRILFLGNLPLGNLPLGNLPLSNPPFGNLRLSAISLSLSLSKLTVTEDGQNDISMQQRMAQVIVRRIVRDFATTQFTLDVGWSYAGLTPCCHLQIPKKLFVVATVAESL